MERGAAPLLLIRYTARAKSETEETRGTIRVVGVQRVTSSMSPGKKNDTLAELEDTQAALRQNIEDSKDLIAKSEQLLERHRTEQARLAGGAS